VHAAIAAGAGTMLLVWPDGGCHRKQFPLLR